MKIDQLHQLIKAVTLTILVILVLNILKKTSRVSIRRSKILYSDMIMIISELNSDNL